MTHRLSALVSILTLLSALPAAAAQTEDTAKIRKFEGGFYKQQFKSAGVTYIVDTHAQVCFLSERGGGMALISCKALKRRPEWAKVLGFIEGFKKKHYN